MSKPDLVLIRSQSAEAYRRSVTKGIYDQCYSSLRVSEVIWREWDRLYAESE